MVKPIKFDESGDSADLQSLFDSIAGGAAPAVLLAEPEPSGDSDDLQALFNSVCEQVAESDAASGAAADTGAAAAGQATVFNHLGHLTRRLHDSLHDLGYDKSLEATARQIPDARDRLDYIVRMTEQAASRVLNATDIAMPAQDALEQGVKMLGPRWERMFANQLTVDEFKQLAADTRYFFAAAPDRIAVTKTQLTEIMLAQDFQDLTGQVIKKIVDVVQNVETQLLQVLIEAMPAEKKAEASGLMNGPVINAAGRNDVVTSQEQVDDLLESLGF